MSDTQPDWRPVATLDMLRRRAHMLAEIRAFFAERGVLEVETPVLSQAGVTDPNLQNLVTDCLLPGDAEPRRLFLQTSPEYAMKRLLAAGSGSIYQIGKVFRGGEAGRFHNPEFTLLEWYRPGFDFAAIMDETAELLRRVLGAAVPVERLSYRVAFQQYIGIDPLCASIDELAQQALKAGLDVAEPQSFERDHWLDLLLSERVAPKLGSGSLLFLTSFPATQAALARLQPDDPSVAERFEVFIAGIEIANGFYELTDASEQRRRFESDLAQCRKRGLKSVPVDERLLGALVAGLPPSSGVALGLDRLLMVATGSAKLEQVLAFPVNRA